MKNQEEDTLKKILMIGALVFAAATVAETANAAEFYVVHDSTTKKCTIVDKRPAETPNLVIGDGHKTRAEAEAAMQKVCTEPAK